MENCVRKVLEDVEADKNKLEADKSNPKADAYQATKKVYGSLLGQFFSYQIRDG